MLSSSRYPGLLYDQHQGHFWRMKYEGSDLVTDRRLIPDQDGYLIYFCAYLRKPIKKKANKIAWEIVYDISSKNLYFVHRNLQTDDYSALNICALSRDEYRKFKDAYLNINGAIKIKARENDTLSYIVQYKRNGKNKIKSCHDIVYALRFKKKLLLYSTKVLGKYANTA